MAPVTIVPSDLAKLLDIKSSHTVDNYYYKNMNGYEADFVVCKGNKVLGVYQVCYDISSEKTLKRELRGLLTAAKETRCENLFLITDFRRDTVQQEGKTIQILPAYEWMLWSDGI